MIYKFYEKIKNKSKLKIYFLNYDKKKKKINKLVGNIKKKSNTNKNSFFCLEIKYGKYKVYKNFCVLSPTFLYYKII